MAELCEWIRTRIQRQTLVPGQRLVEAELMRETGASRSRVREALQRLEQEGLVQIEEFRGASVKRFSKDDLRQIYRARMALEGLAAAEFAESGSDQEKARLAELQDQLNALENSGDHSRFAVLNDEWHRTITEGANNSYVESFINRLRVPIYRLLFPNYYRSSRIDDANADHKKVTAAILNGESDLAEKLMREHIAKGLVALGDIEQDQ